MPDALLQARQKRGGRNPSRCLIRRSRYSMGLMLSRPPPAQFGRKSGGQAPRTTRSEKFKTCGDRHSNWQMNRFEDAAPIPMGIINDGPVTFG